nr:unnamed protein product [Digitaria exilis]
MLHDGSSGDNAPFDINDFPQLTGRPNSAGGGQGQYGSLRKHGVSVNAIVQQNQEFSIQNEDFPALPGYKGVFSPNTIVSLIMRIVDNSCPGSSSDYAMDMHHKDHLHENVNIMQAQHYPLKENLIIKSQLVSLLSHHQHCKTTLFSITKQWRRDLPFLLPHKILDENYKLSP